MELRIREAIPEDAGQLVDILNPIIEAGIYSALDTTYSVEEEIAFIRAFPARGVFLVAIRAEDDRVVGMQSLEPFASCTHAFDHVGVIGTYVALDARRSGIAHRLFETMFERARAKQYEKIFTYVRADNEAGLAAYLGQGFRVVGTAERHAKIRGQYIDEIMIERFL